MVKDRRIVLLGASNLVRGISTVVNTARQCLGGPVDLRAALGHGRSYGMTSRVLGRSLPSIRDCGLWDSLEQDNGEATFGLLTDIGNDILYGASVESIARWVDGCLQRLTPLCQQIVVTELPLASLQTLGPLRFRLMRSVLFPKSQLTFEDALDRAGQLNSAVVELANEKRCRIVQPTIDWYGLDPIHIRSRNMVAAWQTILASWSEAAGGGDLNQGRSDGRIADASLGQWFNLRRQRPHQRWLFGIEQTCPQPCCTLRDGSSISFY